MNEQEIRQRALELAVATTGETTSKDVLHVAREYQDFLEGGPPPKGYVVLDRRDPLKDLIKSSSNVLRAGFGWALDELHKGRAVSRDGWNGKGMFIYLVPAASYPAQSGAAKAHFGENALVPYGAYLAMKTVEGRVVPWLASQTDILAEDWGVVLP